MITCPTPLPAKDRILLGHGSGGRLSAELLRDIFLPVFRSPVLGRLDDQAILQIGSERLAFTTDSFVVHPLFFPGGDVGRLAVNGTVNDLAMSGARPLYLSLGFIIEEGLAVDDLTRVVASIREAAREASVDVVAGDTKVVERGKGDGLFITSSGVGVIEAKRPVTPSEVRAGDAVLVSGTVGQHGVAVIWHRRPPSSRSRPCGLQPTA